MPADLNNAGDLKAMLASTTVYRSFSTAAEWIEN